MRYAFVNTLKNLAKKDKRIFLLTGDLGYTVFEGFAKEFPKRFINMGVAEANMVGVAAGLASTGKIPFIYSIATFMSMRPYEQIRVDVCAQNRNVKIVGVGGGLSYGHAGLTHHSTEDIAIMRALPNMTVVCPADPVETEMAIRSVVREPGPVYIRLGKSGEPKIHDQLEGFTIGKSITVKEGKDVVIYATGNQVFNSLKAAELLEEKGINAKVISMHTIKPLDEDSLKKELKTIKKIVTVEEHNIIGGLGSAVAEVIAESKDRAMLKRIGIKDRFTKVVGSHDFLREHHELSPELIAKEIEDFYHA